MDCNNRNLNALNNVPANNSCVPKKNLKDFFQPRENENRKKKLLTKTTQVNLEAWVSDDDLLTDIPAENYWKVVAEKRRMALGDALKENERLWKLHEALTQEISQNKQLLEEANTFIEVFKDLVQDTANDTGIDVGDNTASDRF